MKKIYAILIFFLVLLFSVTTPVHADIGPKASLLVHIKGCDEQYSFELLTYEPVIDEEKMNQDWYEPYAYYKEEYPEFFYTYLDDENYAAYSLYSIPSTIYYEGSTNDTDTYLMNYLAPRDFKIALYVDDTGVLIVSDVVQTTLFESEVTWDLTGETFDTNQEGIGTLSGTIEGDPEGLVWTKTLVQTIYRVVGTILIELGILFLFGIRRKDLFIKVGIVNIVTQTALSAFVITIYLTGGSLAYVLFLFVGEFFVLITELIACIILLKGRFPVWKTMIFVLLANVASMILGHLVMWILLIGV